jgi:putative transcriptional regulator
LALINYCQAPRGPLTTLALTNALTFGNPPGQRMVAVAFSLNDLLALIIGGVLYVAATIMLARRKMRSKELAERIGITEQNVSLLKSGKVKGARFETLERICEALACQPGDILEFRPDKS